MLEPSKHTDEKTAYQEALDYLYTFVDYSLTKAFKFSPEKFDLTRMAHFLALLDNPQNKYRIIHITGTKGKGSVSAMIASAFKAQGYRTGFYTSPHLQEYNERIQVNGCMISNADFVTLVNELKPIISEINLLTTFEITTGLAFLYFARQKVDVAVVEVGLGGRLDATNTVNPMVSVITSISYDHTSVLGDTLTKIAAEKSGIIKPGRPVVMEPQRDEARAVIEQAAQTNGSALIMVGRDILFAPGRHSLDGQSLQVWTSSEQPQADKQVHREWEQWRLGTGAPGYPPFGLPPD
jgi:dihydrofolate synthase / folylpolyglutamate synthase